MKKMTLLLSIVAFFVVGSFALAAPKSPVEKGAGKDMDAGSSIHQAPKEDEVTFWQVPSSEAHRIAIEDRKLAKQIYGRLFREKFYYPDRVKQIEVELKTLKDTDVSALPQDRRETYEQVVRDTERALDYHEQLRDEMSAKIYEDEFWEEMLAEMKKADDLFDAEKWEESSKIYRVVETDLRKKNEIRKKLGLMLRSRYSAEYEGRIWEQMKDDASKAAKELAKEAEAEFKMGEKAQKADDHEKASAHFIAARSRWDEAAAEASKER